MKLAYQVHNECVYSGFWRMGCVKQSQNTRHMYRLVHSFRQVWSIYKIPVLMKEQCKRNSPVKARIIPSPSHMKNMTILWSQNVPNMLYHSVSPTKAWFLAGVWGIDGAWRDALDFNMHQRCQRCAHLFVGCMQIWSQKAGSNILRWSQPMGFDNSTVLPWPAHICWI